MKALDLRNLKFGRLLVIALAKEKHLGIRVWQCLCDCGNEKFAITKTLRNGRTRSCGCLHIESSLKKIKDLGVRPIGYERTTSKGYIEIRTENGFKRKHVHVMEMHLGRKLNTGEVVHHKDQNKTNNDLSNLELMTHAEHTILHNQLKAKKWRHSTNVHSLVF